MQNSTSFQMSNKSLILDISLLVDNGGGGVDVSNFNPLIPPPSRHVTFWIPISAPLTLLVGQLTLPPRYRPRVRWAHRKIRTANVFVMNHEGDICNPNCFLTKDYRHWINPNLSKMCWIWGKVNKPDLKSYSVEADMERRMFRGPRLSEEYLSLWTKSFFILHWVV